jgi:hypothetical protein
VQDQIVGIRLENALVASDVVSSLTEGLRDGTLRVDPNLVMSVGEVYA